jgi:hypothetical protein
MKSNTYLVYTVIAVGATAVALLAGMPPVYLLLLACPLMMMFMMRGMNMGQRPESTDKTSGRSPDSKNSDTVGQPPSR